MRQTLAGHAASAGRMLRTASGRRVYAGELLSDGLRLELANEPGRALSESEAVDAIQAGWVVEVVT